MFLIVITKFVFVVFVRKIENETPGWTQLKLPGQAPSPRCGHTVTSGGHYVICLDKFSIFCICVIASS